MELKEILNEIIQKLSEEIIDNMHNGVAMTDKVIVKTVPVEKAAVLALLIQARAVL